MASKTGSMTRPMWIVLGVTAALLVALAVLWGFYFSQLGSRFDGTELNPPNNETDFTLHDQTGAEFQLSSTRGKVVILAFIYTHCTDVCPFVAAKLRRANELLGSDASKVAIVAVTTDPGRDTQAVAAAYSRQFGLYDTWHFVVGTQAQLQPIWQAYYVGSEIDQGVPGHHDEPPQPLPEATMQAMGLDNGLTASDVATAQQAISLFGGGYHVTHSTPIWLIDPSGQVRVLLRQSASPSEIVHDVRLLLP